MKWQRTPTGRLKAPSFPKLEDNVVWEIDPFKETYNKTPLSKVEDFVYFRESGIRLWTGSSEEEQEPFKLKVEISKFSRFTNSSLLAQRKSASMT